MNPPRIGKIARLPHTIRDQINRRLHDGQKSSTLLTWLNSLPEVKTVLGSEFDGRPISKQNLSEWKQGGFHDWLLQQQAFDFLRCFPEAQSAEGAPPVASLTAKLLHWTLLQYAAAASAIASDPARKWTDLRALCADLARLRRGDLYSEYLRIQRDWLALDQAKDQTQKEKDFWAWTKRPDISQKLFPDHGRGLTEEKIKEIEEALCLFGGRDERFIAGLMAKKREAREAFKRAEASGATVEELLKEAATDPELADEVQMLALEDQAQSNPVKPGQTIPPAPNEIP